MTRSRLGLVVAALLGGGVCNATVALGESSCSSCHGAEAREWEEGTHRDLELDCTGCHGGNPALLSREACVDGPEFLGVPSGAALVEICGSCHSNGRMMNAYGLAADQLARYKESGHGRSLYEDGDKNVATCVSCHDAHAVFSAQDPRALVHRRNLPRTCATCHADADLMARYGLPATIFADYAKSVHGARLLAGVDLGLPTCSDCHGSHGAAPPGVREVVNVCGHCHISTRDYFVQSPHFAASRAGEMEECISCHGSHAVRRTSAELFLADADGGCVSCHAPDESDPGFAAARKIAASLRELEDALEGIRTGLTEAQGSGLFIDAEKSYMEDARRLLVQVGPMTHAVDPELVAEVAREGRAMIQETEESLSVKARQFRDRRIMTAIIFVFLLGMTGLLTVRWWEIHRWAEVDAFRSEIRDR